MKGTHEVLTPDARARTDAVAEGLYTELTASPVAEHERNAGPVFALLRSTRATTMLVPVSCGGLGTSAQDAVRFQVALGSVAPSAAIATAMHHYKIAALSGAASDGDEHARTILVDIARGAALVASGGAESTPGRDLSNLGSHAVREGDGYRITGIKRPCSLSTSMDTMSLMVELRDSDGSSDGYAQAFVDANCPGLERRLFWRSPVFLAAESHAVSLTDVRVPESRIFPLRGRIGERFAVDCYLWFQLLISASYLGVACCVAEATPTGRRSGARGWARAVADLRSLEQGVLEAAAAVDAKAPVGEQLNLAVRARDRVEDEIGAIGARLLRAAGGGAFAGESLPTMLTGGLNAIAFHPPQRGAREGVGLELLDTDVRERA